MEIVKSNNFITPGWGLWNFYLTAEVVSHFQWCKRYSCFVSNPKIPASATFLVWEDTRSKRRNRTSHLASTTCLFPLGIILSQPYPTLAFVHIPRSSFLKANKPTLSKAQQNIPDMFTALSASAVLSTRSGQGGYTHLDDCRAEQKAQPCLRHHPGRVQSCKWALEPHWHHGLQLPVTAEHHPGAAESHKKGAATPWCKSNFSVPTEDSKNSGLETRNKEDLLCSQFSILLTNPEQKLSSFCWALKRLAWDVLLGAVLELFIPRGSPVSEETPSLLLQAQASSTSP